MRKYLLATLLLILFVCTMGPVHRLLSRYLLQDEPTFHQIQDDEWLSKIALRYYGDISYWRELELINRAPDGDRIFPGEEIIIPSFEVVSEIRKTQRLSMVNRLIHEQQTILAGRPRQRTPERQQLESEIADEIKTEVIESFEQRATENSVSESEDKVAAPPVKSSSQPSERAPGVTVSDVKAPATVTAYDEVGDELAQQNSTLSIVLLGGVALLLAVLIIGVVVYLRRHKQEEVTVYGDAAEAEEQDSIRPGFLMDSTSFEDDVDDAGSDEEDVRNGVTKERELA